MKESVLPRFSRRREGPTLGRIRQSRGGASRNIALLLAALCFNWAVPMAQEVGVGRLDRISEVGPAILAFWRPPPDSAGMALTLVFSFKRNGEILGKPRISFSKLHGDSDLQERFVVSALKALAACTPLHITSSLGGAIAGRPFAMIFKATAPSQGV